MKYFDMDLSVHNFDSAISFLKNTPADVAIYDCIDILIPEIELWYNQKCLEVRNIYRRNFYKLVAGHILNIALRRRSDFHEQCDSLSTEFSYTCERINDLYTSRVSTVCDISNNVTRQLEQTIN